MVCQCAVLCRIEGYPGSSSNRPRQVSETIVDRRIAARLRTREALRLFRKTPKAQGYFRKAATVAQSKPDAVAANEVLGKASQFLLRCRRWRNSTRVALAQNPANGDARIVLLSLLANRLDPQSLQETSRILDEEATKRAIDSAHLNRLRAIVLLRQGKPQDLEAAIKLLQLNVSPNHEEKVFLARLYEQSGQIELARELFQQLARSPMRHRPTRLSFCDFGSSTS